MRVLVGTTEVGGLIQVFGDAFRRLGLQVTTAIRARHPFYENVNYDVDLEIGGPIERALRLTQLIAQHDLFVFQWAGDSLRWHSELPLLRRLGKRIVFVLLGDDVRSSFAYQQEASFFYSPEEQSFILSPDHQERLENDPIVGALSRLRVAERFSDLILSVPCNSTLAVRPYDHLFVPIDLTEYKSSVPGREIPLIVHAPSAKSVKGTDWIIPALDRLKSEGVQFELRLLSGMPHPQVKQELFNADVVVDQLFFPLHGKLGVEAMATGCALASSNREDFEPYPPNRPIWHLDPGNVYMQLKRILTDKDLRMRLAYEGRAYVERYHDHEKVAGRIVERLSSDRITNYDHYPTFYAEQLKLPSGVVLPNDLQRITARIVQRWGLPKGLDPQSLIDRGLMSAGGLRRSKPIPRWHPN